MDAALEQAVRRAANGDTTKLEVIDAAGNMVSATPSGGWLPSSPVIPGLGFPLGTRGQMFSLTKAHPNCLAPGKRPRTTLTPSLALRDGAPFMVFGSPGGDAQDQWALQFLLNVVEFGMSLQEAVEAPTFWTSHFPSSFYPRAAEPGSLYIEKRIGKRVRDRLAVARAPREGHGELGSAATRSRRPLTEAPACAAPPPRRGRNRPTRRDGSPPDARESPVAAITEGEKISRPQEPRRQLPRDQVPAHLACQVYVTGMTPFSAPRTGQLNIRNARTPGQPKG